MNSAHAQPEPQIIVCGNPRLLPQLLGHVLHADFCPVSISPLPHPPPSVVGLMQPTDWLIWFLGMEGELEPALGNLLKQGARLNVMLLSSDGHAIVRWADKGELRRANISLDEVLGILKVPADAHSHFYPLQDTQLEEEEWKH